MIGGVFSAVGSIVGAAISARATKKATKMQIQALERQQKFVFDQLEPGKINIAAKKADVQRAKARLALQGKLDPDLLRARYAAQEKMLRGVEEIGAAPSDVAAQTAFDEATAQATTGVAAQLKQRMIDAALEELDMGATLPSDVQAELVKAGLERSGTVLGAATPRGLGGNIARSMIGERALALKAERQARAQTIAQTAQALESNRNQLMLSLFPQLQQQQLKNLAAATGTLQASAAELPQAGLGGESIANIWLARVGATSQLGQAQADAAARGTMAQGQIWGTALGTASQFGGQALNTAFPNFGTRKPEVLTPTVRDWTVPPTTGIIPGGSVPGYDPGG